jgi:hypothetical protein
MISSVVNQIMVAVVAALTNATDAGSRVYRSRTVAISRGETPCIAVTPHREETTAFGQDVDKNVFDIEVEIFVRGDPFDELADPILAQVHRLLKNDPGVNALLTEIRKKDKDWDAQEADETAGVVVTTYQVRYLSSANDITVLV